MTIEEKLIAIRDEINVTGASPKRLKQLRRQLYSINVSESSGKIIEGYGDAWYIKYSSLECIKEMLAKNL